MLVLIENDEIDRDTYSPAHSSASSEKLDRSDLESSADTPDADEARYSDLDIYSRTPTPANARMPPKITLQVSMSQAVQIAGEISSLVDSQAAAVEKVPESSISTVERPKEFTPVNSPLVNHPSASAAAGTMGMIPKTKAGQVFWAHIRFGLVAMVRGTLSHWRRRRRISFRHSQICIEKLHHMSIFVGLVLSSRNASCLG